MQIVENQDLEWQQDWNTIVNIFGIIDKLRSHFERLDVTYLREVQQKVLILNLEKYVWSLQNYIIEKYKEEKI